MAMKEIFHHRSRPNQDSPAEFVQNIPRKRSLLLASLAVCPRKCFRDIYTSDLAHLKCARYRAICQGCESRPIRVACESPSFLFQKKFRISTNAGEKAVASF
jgi:hypothetical protein